MAHEEMMTLEQLFREEQQAIIEWIARIELLKANLDPFAPEYFTLQNDSMMLEQTAIYLERRLNCTLPPAYLGD